MGLDQDNRTKVMAFYATHLATGATILAITIKVATIKYYIKAVNELFLSYKKPNYLLNDSGKQAKKITDLLKEAERWEKVPNCKEPVTPEMVDYMILKVNEATAGDERYHFYMTMSDWCILGLQTGYRKS